MSKTTRVSHGRARLGIAGLALTAHGSFRGAPPRLAVAWVEPPANVPPSRCHIAGLLPWLAPAEEQLQATPQAPGRRRATCSFA
eukprot:3111382-Alexandrium_andersonii.AAC.1